jgi:hypothetical protein
MAQGSISKRNDARDGLPHVMADLVEMVKLRGARCAIY